MNPIYLKQFSHGNSEIVNLQLELSLQKTSNGMVINCHKTCWINKS